MKRFRVNLLVLFIATLVPAKGQLLWPRTEAGQTVEEVQQRFPEAHAPESPAGLPRGRGVELLVLDSVAIADRAFTVRFFFKDRLLVQVLLETTGQISFKDFEKYRDLLRRKYELERSTVNGDHLLVTWKVGQTTLTLAWTPKGRDIATLTITYDAPIAKTTDLL
ncbi:MAG: hypothetical protein JWM88_932 [Verrucomicrobia bacterium]|nr:hypothetical protein [Verrucomicrobiota bacterium]